MADSGNHLSSFGKLLRKLEGVGIVGKIDHGAVSTDVKYGVKIGSLAEELGDLLGGLVRGFVVLQEVGGNGVRLEGIDAASAEGRFTALGGNDGDFDAGLLEDVVRVSKLGLE